MMKIRLLRYLRGGWERFLLYFPLIIMGLLASGTYWLVRTTPASGTATPPRPVRHEVDYFLNDFSVKTFDATGRIRNELRGTKAQHFADSEWLEVEGVELRHFDEQGQLTTASADKGLISEHEQIVLTGRVRGVLAPSNSNQPNNNPP